MENDLSDDELAQFEEECKVTEDKFDRLYLFQQELERSRLNQTYKIKRASSLGPKCPYYIKALRLFKQEEEERIINRMRELIAEWDGEYLSE